MPRGRPRSAHAHRAILDATLKLLADVGYEQLTVGEVAAVAGVGKATIYRRWPSKAPLVIEAFSQLPALVAPDTGNLLDDLTGLLRSFAKILETTPLPRVLPILAAESLHDPELSKLFLPMAGARREPLIAILRRAMARDELPADLDVEAAADVVVGPIMTRVCSPAASQCVPATFAPSSRLRSTAFTACVGAGDLADRLRRADCRLTPSSLRVYSFSSLVDS